jgi:hypothetical protein
MKSVADCVDVSFVEQFCTSRSPPKRQSLSVLIVATRISKKVLGFVRIWATCSTLRHVKGERARRLPVEKEIDFFQGTDCLATSLQPRPFG